MKYQIYFRIRRGGTGIPYALAKTEFLAVFGEYGLQVEREHVDRRRMWVNLDLPPNQVAALASDLGYTESVLHLHIEPYRGESLFSVERGRWYIGWIRQREWKICQTEVYVQNAESLSNEALDGRCHLDYPATAHYAQRALSFLDARFLFNIARFTPEMRILDPFAGCGGLIFEARRRGLSIFASDVDSRLSPGLAKLALRRAFVGDARLLPLPANQLDAIITEPPFRTRYRQTVMDALTELHRVLKPTGKIVLMIAADMGEGIRDFFERRDGCVRVVEVIPRDGGLKCPVLEISFPE